MNARRMRDDPQFFPREKQVLGLRTTTPFDYSSSREALRRLAQDRAVRLVLLAALALLGLAATGFGALHAQGRWHAALPALLFSAAVPWSEPWWRQPDKANARGYGIALAVAAALVLLPSLAHIRGDSLFAPAVLLGMLAFAWPFHRPESVPEGTQAAMTIVLLAATLTWPMLHVLSGPALTMAAAGALAAAIASYFLALGSAAQRASMSHPELVIRLSLAMAAAAVTVGTSESVNRWLFGLAACVGVAGLTRLRPPALLGQEAPWNLLLAASALSLYSMAIVPDALAEQMPWQVAALAGGYAAAGFACVRRARHWLESRPARLVRISPQATVPLFDRSGHHPAETWRA